MLFERISIGTDIEKISRFENKNSNDDKDFLAKIFTSKEIDYSFSKKKYAQHLCARFCAKEAIIKALSEFKIHDVYYRDIEINNEPDGHPNAFIPKYPNIKIKISLSHNKTDAISMVMLHKE